MDERQVLLTQAGENLGVALFKLIHGATSAELQEVAIRAVNDRLNAATSQVEATRNANKMGLEELRARCATLSATIDTLRGTVESQGTEIRALRETWDQITRVGKKKPTRRSTTP